MGPSPAQFDDHDDEPALAGYELNKWKCEVEIEKYPTDHQSCRNDSSLKNVQMKSMNELHFCKTKHGGKNDGIQWFWIIKMNMRNTLQALVIFLT